MHRSTLARHAVVTCAALLLFGAAVDAPLTLATPAQAAQGPELSPLARANALLATLSFDQKIAIALGDFASVANLGIPALSFDDGPNGVRADGTTAFPSAQALASTFDRQLATAYGQAVGAEARGKGFNAWLAPAMDIARTPLAGRQPENQGEDPFLVGHTVAAEVSGVKTQHVIATLKHYVGNNQEYQRFGFNIGPGPRGPAINDIVDERALQEIYEAPFRIGVQVGGADAAMCSYNRVNGEQTCESPSLLGTLKNDWGFNGYVIPDFGFAVRDVLAATNAGVDVPALGGPGGRTAAMFTSGQVSASRLDDIVRRTLFAMFDSGVFNHPLPAPAAAVSTPAHLDLATRIAESSMVLLKNEHAALPLSTGRVRSIAVIGPSGQDAIFVNGGSASVPLNPGAAITPLAGITSRAGAQVNVHVAQGSLGDVALPTLVPAAVLTPSTGAGAGLLATYWNNGDLSGSPALTRVEPGVDLSAPPAGVSRQLWSARWSGTLPPPDSGLYRFSVLSAGLVHLSIDNRVVASGYREATQFLGGPQYPIQASVRLRAGQPVAIQIDYSSKAQLFGAQIHLAWQPPSASLIEPAVDAARSSDVAIVLVNGAQGEGMDRSTLALAGDQNQLIESVAAVNKRTIVVVNTGGPVLMPWLGRVDAVVQAWYPGQQFGTALAAVLFGDVDPGGRLPVTFPASDDQGPAPPSQPDRYPGVNGDEHYAEGIDVGYRWYDQFHQQPLFPFGFGLSYARFRFSDLDLSLDRDDGSIRASVRVTNVSERRGSSVAELYLASPPAAHEPPHQLKGYARTVLGPGESQRVSFQLNRSDLAYFDSATNSFVVANGHYTISVGTSSRDLDTHQSFEIGERDAR